jgi:glycosyltransferase involved in cell wall biosynthesis
MMLWKLLSRMDRSRFEPLVFALSSNADGMLDRFKQIGVDCHLIGMKPSVDALAGLFRLGRALRRVTPDIVQGWLYHGNVAATIASGLIRIRPPVLWSIRCTLPKRLSQEKWQSALTIWAGAKLSFSAARIIHNSFASAVEHEGRLGYRRNGRVILPNGFDTDVFRPSAEARIAVRKMLHVPDDTILVGLVGRYHPQKDHRNFLQAAALVRRTHANVHFLLVGEGITRTNAHLNRMVHELDLCECAHLVGPRDDVDVITAALDVACCSSAYGEGFANVIGEAMSCGVPCAVTDVSDAARIVGDTGKVVAARDSEALARAIGELIDMGSAKRQALGSLARERVIENFSLDAIVRQYEQLYLSVYERASRERKH